MDPFAELITNLGLPIALVIYFVWRDTKRSKEDRLDKRNLAERITEIENYQKDKLEDLAVKSSLALEKSSESNDRLVKISERVFTALSKRPCLTKDLVTE